MSWQITIADDPDTTGEQTVTGIWTELDGKTLTISVRGKATEESMAAGIVRAIAARDAWQEKNKMVEAIRVDVQNRLNAADPQGVK
jgi:hypothetical protein